MIALTRDPSASRASTSGEDSSMRRPTRETMRSMTRRRCSSELNRDVRRGQLAAAFDVDLVRSVDHDFGDGRLVQEPLERSVPQHVVHDFLNEPLPFRGSKGNLLLVHDGPKFVLDVALQLGLVEGRISDPATHAFVERGARPILDGVKASLASVPRTFGSGAMDGDSAANAGPLDQGPLAATGFVEATVSTPPPRRDSKRLVRFIKNTALL